jgi:hypothetical protein
VKPQARADRAAIVLEAFILGYLCIMLRINYTKRAQEVTVGSLVPVAALGWIPLR